MLLKEEMRRVIEFLHWKSRWWQEKEEGRKDNNGDLLEGLRAYGRKQGILQERLADDFVKIWQSIGSDTQLWAEKCDDGGSDADGDEDEDEDEGGVLGEEMDGADDDDDDPMEG